MKYQLLILACYAFTSILPLSSADVSITSSAGIYFKPKKSSNSFGSIIFARANGFKPPRLSRQELLMWFIIRFTSSWFNLSKVVIVFGRIFLIYSCFFHSVVFAMKLFDHSSRCLFLVCCRLRIPEHLGAWIHHPCQNYIEFRIILIRVHTVQVRHSSE